jgi:hypothetical protein
VFRSVLALLAYYKLQVGSRSKSQKNEVINYKAAKTLKLVWCVPNVISKDDSKFAV